MRITLRIVVLAVAFHAAAGSLQAQQVEDQFFDSDGVSIRYIEKGEGEPVVLIHGFCANLDVMWLLPGMVDGLAKEYRVIAIDCRGHGKSGKPHDAAKYGEEMVADVIRLLDHLKIEKAHLLGYSMGGMITFKLMTDHPERVLSALPCGFGWAPKVEGDHLMMEQLAVALEEHGSIRPLMEYLEAGDAVVDEAQFEQVDQMIRLMNDTKALAAVARGMADLRPDEDKLKTNAVPALAIVGSEDPLHEGAESMIDRMPELEVRIIDGGDHMTTFTNPEFMQSILVFLKSHAAVKSQ